MSNPYDLRAKYTRFRILVIGRANAGKTTLLQRVCNTTEDPCIYDENNKNLLEPTSARGIHDIRRPFAFRSNPGFVFHDSPGFETGDERQLQEVLSFMEEKAKSTEVDDQLHAIWFCFVLNGSRPLFPLETAFFETARAGKAPVIAIFTKFDDLMTQIYDLDLDDDDNRKIAEEQVEKKFRKPLRGYTFPPRADVCFEALHTNETGKHQDQVKVLIEKTASSLDETALKMLFVSVQQNNIDLCVQYAINHVINKIGDVKNVDVAFSVMFWFGHAFIQYHDYGQTEIDDIDQIVQERDPIIQEQDEDEEDEQRAHAFMGFLHANFSSNDSSLATTFSCFKMPSIHILTALLICLENSFWNKNTDGGFIDRFKESFTLYVESGVREKMGADVDVLINEYDGHPMADEFKRKLHKIVKSHYLPHPEDNAAVAV